MYFYDRQLTDLHQSSSYLGWAPPYSDLGETLAPPKGLILFDHFHSPKTPNPITGTFVFGPVTKLVASDMNPGFIDASDKLIINTSSNGLQSCLRKLITTQFQNYLSNKSNTSPAKGDRLQVALVDLTGSKITQPDFAEWGSDFSMFGASVPKILGLYAAFQLRSDLRNLARTQNISSGSRLEAAAKQNWTRFGLKRGFPDLNWLFDILKWSGAGALNFSSKAQFSFSNIKENCPAGELIVRVGFPYIASVTWQSGLRDWGGGMWLPTAYCGKGRWSNNPIPIPVGVSNIVTALSVATYFTLLAQRRLVDDAASIEIMSSLGRGCKTKYFPPSLKLSVVASKCGVLSYYWHDCALIVRGSIRYVVVGLTRTYQSEYSKYRQLFLELDNLIVQNNQSPKPSC